jgi:pyrimidine deaminase RibD-like protein
LWYGTFEDCVEIGETEGCPDELAESRIGTIWKCVDDGDEKEEVGLRIFEGI